MQFCCLPVGGWFSQFPLELAANQAFDELIYPRHASLPGISASYWMRTAFLSAISSPSPPLCEFKLLAEFILLSSQLLKILG